MTADQWLSHRAPAPPEALAARIRELVHHDGEAQYAEDADALIAAAERALARLLQDGCSSRGTALDLLAADAIATYAFEAAADDPARIVERTDRAMKRIAALADTPLGDGSQVDQPGDCR